MFAVSGCQLDRVPCVSQIFEMDTLNHTALIDIQTGNDTNRYRHAIHLPPRIKRLKAILVTAPISLQSTSTLQTGNIRSANPPYQA